MEKPLKTAAWAGLIALILSIILIPFLLLTAESAFKSIVSLFGSIGGGILGILFLYGFIVLGKKFKNTLLIVMAWIGIAFAILSLFFGLIGGIISLAGNVSAQEESIGKMNDVIDTQAIMGVIIIFLIFWIALSLFIGAYSILFGVGLLKLKDKVKYAKPAGILNIVAGATYIILAGFLVRMVAYIFEIAMFFRASRKFER